MIRIFIFIFCWNALFAEMTSSSARRPVNSELTGYVVANEPVWRRLGNQLFCISSILAYSWDHGFKPVFPALNRSDNQLSYNRDRIFFRLDSDASNIPIHHRYNHKTLLYDPLPVFKNTENVSIKGQFFSWRYFHHRRAEILEIYKPSPEITLKLQSKYSALIDSRDTVGVHVRTYSKAVHENGLRFLGLNYFVNAFNLFPKETCFVIFSDRINWCRHHFTRLFPGKKFVFIEGNDHIEDLFLLSLMKHQILSNSTFSWWGAYLNQNPDKIVLCPNVFFQDASVLHVEDLYLPEWVVMDDDFTQDPYPDDILQYDNLTPDDTQVY